MTADERKARRMHTHVVTFKSGSDEEDVAVQAMIGFNSKAIGNARGLSVGQVQYRIKKAGLVGERGRFRSGVSAMSKLVYRLARTHARKQVQSKIAPKFHPYEDR